MSIFFIILHVGCIEMISKGRNTISIPVGCSEANNRLSTMSDVSVVIHGLLV
jgi:hypothetical protein